MRGQERRALASLALGGLVLRALRLKATGSCQYLYFCASKASKLESARLACLGGVGVSICIVYLHI